MGKIVFGDNLPVLQGLPDTSVDLIYVDPPFNTGKRQEREWIKTVQDETNGDRTGFAGRRYQTIRLGKSVLLDQIFGRDSFMNEIIWAYDYGARSKKKWSAKHDSILWYAKDPADYTFNFDEMDRIPYMAPGLVGKEKAARGKTPTDVWWHTIVSPNGKEKTGYATQKPLGVLERLVKVHSKPGDLLLDFFAGSGTLGEAAAKHGRDYVLIDNNPEAIQVMIRRLSPTNPDLVGCDTLFDKA